jgi:hypothetical protein
MLSGGIGKHQRSCWLTSCADLVEEEGMVDKAIDAVREARTRPV